MLKMEWTDFFTALGIVLILEGIMPFLNPRKWKQMLYTIGELGDTTLRMGGLILMICGLVFIYYVRN